MRKTIYLHSAPTENASTRPPQEITCATTRRPHDTCGKTDLDQIAARALVGQITPIGKGRTRAHYEAMLAELRGEQGAQHA